ncbi:MAG: hypothetical protein V1826_02450 [bacterium]
MSIFTKRLIRSVFLSSFWFSVILGALFALCEFIEPTTGDQPNSAMMVAVLFGCWGGAPIWVLVRVVGKAGLKESNRHCLDWANGVWGGVICFLGYIVGPAGLVSLGMMDLPWFITLPGMYGFGTMITWALVLILGEFDVRERFKESDQRNGRQLTLPFRDPNLPIRPQQLKLPI